MNGLHWITPHSLFSLTWSEWGSIIAILTAIVIIIRWVIRKLDVELFESIRNELGDINNNLTKFNARQIRIEARLGNGDRKFIHHDEQLQDHERRITRLEDRKDESK